MRRNFIFFMTALMLLITNAFTAFGQTQYEKVTSAPTDWSGEYLLVYEESETSAYVWTGVDAVNCYTTSSISQNVISAEQSVTITIATMEGGYSVKINGGDNNGKYISHSANSNGLTTGDNAVAQVVTYSDNSVLMTNGGGAVMRFNSANNQMRFRFYKSSSYSSQQPVQLYKKVESGNAVATPTFSPAAGTYAEAQNVTINCETEGATIFYTTDGTTPDTLSTVYSTPISISETTTVKAIAMKAGLNNSSVATATYTIEAPLTTMDEIFVKATAAGSTATNVTITFNNWVVTGVAGSNAYLTDGTKGLIIYGSGHGFTVGDHLAGTVSCKVQLYQGSSELTNLKTTTTGLTVTPGSTVEPVVMTIDQITSGVYTGAVITISNVSYDGTDAVLSDGTNTIKPFNKLYSGMSFTDGENYNVTGLYLQYNAVKEIMPRNADDIELVQTPGTQVATPTFSPEAGTYTEAQTVTISCETEGATIYYTTDGTTPTSESTVYSAPVSISETTTIKAIAMKEGLDNSNIATATYTIEVPQSGDFGLVSKASDITTDGTYLLVCVSAGTAATNSVSSSALQTAAVTITNNVITTGFNTDGKPYAVTLETATGGYYIKLNNGKYINNASGTGIAAGETASSVWAFNSYEGGMIAQNTSNSNRFLGGSSAEGATYKAYATSNLGGETNPVVMLFKKDLTPSVESVATPTFTPEAGTYTEAQTVTISCTTEGATIYFTTDGTTPTSESTVYSEPISISVTTTVKAIAMKEGLDNSSVATATYTIEAPLTTMDEIFAKATAAGSTATNVTITFNNWVVTGVAGSNAYVTDGTKGLIIYGSGHGFTVGDHLTGTASCKVQLYQGSSELTSLKTTTTGLTVTPGTTVEPVVMTIDQITSGVYTGAVITISNVSYDGTDAVLSDGTNTIKPFNKLYSGMSFTDGESYNVTGLYLQYNAVKEIMPRNADDIELVQTPDTQVATPTFSPEAGTYTEAQNVAISCATEGATIYYTTDGTTPTSESTVYSTPISISETTTVKAIAMKEGLDNSNIATAEYTIEVLQNGDFGRVSKASDITTDGTYLLVCVSAGTAATSSVSSSALQTAAVTVSNNAVTTGYNTNGKPYAVTLETATGGYYIKLNNGKYINNASGTGIAAGETASSVWAFNSYEGGMIAQNTSNSNRFIGGSSAEGATYKAYATSNLGGETNPVVMLFKKDLTPSVESVAAPTFSPEAGTYTEAQTVTISCTTEGATIYFTTDGTTPTSESTVYSEPISISVTTTVKAIAMKEGFDNSEVAEAEYVINTTPVTDGFKKLLSHNDLARISNTTEVMIVDVTGGMALTSANGTNSAPTAVAVAINNDVISGDVDEALLWNVHKVTDGYIFTVKGDNTKWLYTTDANNGVRVGTNEANIWTVDIVDGNYHGMKHNGTNRYIGVYNSQDWRAYTTVNNNIKNTQIEFFINGELPEQTQVTKPEFSIAAGTYTEPFEVAISCSTEGATIFYTTDGTTPDSLSTIYSTPISISETTTVKAVAMKAGLDNSEVAEARYVIPELSSIISARHLSSGDVAIVEGVVTFIDSRNIYIEDTTAAIVLYLNSNTVPDTLAIGDKVKAMGTYDVYNGLVELKNINGNDETQFKIESKGNELPLTNATVSEILSNGLGDYQSMRVKISNAVIGEINTSGNTTLTQNGETVNIYKIPALETISAGANVNVTSVISCYNTIQLRVANASDIIEVVFTATPTALNLFAYSEGFGPSQSQIVTICTKNLENDVTISTGDAFEITKDSIFSHTTTISAGYNDVTILSVRLAAGLSANTYSDILNISTATFEDITITLNGEVSIPGAVETPIISPVSGAFDDPFSVTISCATEGATIYYTTNGTTPDTLSTIYSSAFTVNQNTVVKAIAMKENMINSNIATAEYTFNSMLYADTESLNFSYVEGEGPSSASSVVLTGKNIFADAVNISVSSNFELSLDGSTWNSSETIAPTSAFAVNSTIYVRLKANLAKDEYDGSMTVEAEGVEPVTVTLHGVVSGPAEPWHRISSIDELLDGKRIVIAARHNSTENEFVAVEGKVANKINGILFEATGDANEMYIPEDIILGIDTIAWTVGINEGVYTFTNGSGNMLGYSSGTNFSSSASTTWTVEYAQSGEGAMVPGYFGYIIKNAESTSRAVALNTNDKFGAYSTQNLGSADYNFYMDIFMEGQGAAPTVAKPVFNPASGIYYDDIDLEILCGTPGAEIHYTLDGTEPDESSAIYTGTIVLSEDATTVKAIAYKEGYNASAIAEASYIIDRTITMILEQDWENGWKEWSQVNSGDGDAEWTISSYSGNKYAYINGYNHGSNEVYLISPTFNLNEYIGSNVKLSFRTAQNYSEEGLEVLFSNDFDGENPEMANWTSFFYELSYGNAWTWVESGDIDMNNFSGENCTIAFRYTCGEDNASAWEVDDIRLWAEASDEPFCKVIADLNSFSYVEGHGPSATQQYSFVYGNMEAGNEIVFYNVDGFFELSLDGENFYTEINLTTTDEMTTVPVFVRLVAGLEGGSGYYDKVKHTCGGITKILYVSGYVYPEQSIDENEAFSVNIWNAKNVIVIENENDESIDMTIYNIAGQPVMRVENIDGTQRIGHSLNSGAYIVRVNGTKKVKSQTIIVE